MGAWGVEIFDDDVACDVRSSFDRGIQQKLNILQVTASVLKEYSEYLADNEDRPIVYLALAALQMQHNSLQPFTKAAALEAVENEIETPLWFESDTAIRREKVLQDFKIRLLKS